MSNFTYDSSNDLNWYDPSSGKTFVYNGGDIAWTFASTALVALMIPGAGFFYSGLLKDGSALSMLYLSMMTLAVVSFQWVVWGFSLVYSETGNGFLGDMKYFALRSVLVQPSTGSPRIPQIVFCIYQVMFAAVTPALALGAFAERSRLGPIMIFVFVWTTVVYDPIAHWNWNPIGWSSQEVFGGLDFAGGTPVHIACGGAALAISYVLGGRPYFLGGPPVVHRQLEPHNRTHVVLGTVLLWVGWFGFNGGSALSANLRAANALIVTNTAASVGGVTWLCVDFFRTKHWSVVPFCSGAIAGLVAITPAAGFVSPPSSMAFGLVAGVLCNVATLIKNGIHCDEPLDIFAVHAVGGLIGNILTGIFAQKRIAAYDNITQIKGGCLDGHAAQLGIQLANSAAGLGYSFVMTAVILLLMEYFPLRFVHFSRGNGRGEIFEVDDIEMEERAYSFEAAPSANQNGGQRAD